ncbi:MAG: APC family permease [Acidimicrobiales bacterium]|jgi:amino acid transporter
MDERVQPRTGSEPGEKGLKSGSLNLFSSVMIGVASTAPAYTMAATLGFIAAVIGLKTPAILIAVFIPMMMVAAAFAYMNRADPDCGQSFTWVAHGMGPQVGWVAGFAEVAAEIIGMGMLVDVATRYMYLLVGWQTGANSNFWVAVGAVAWLAAMTAVCALGIELSVRVQYVLMGSQLGALLLFAIVALIRVIVWHPAGSVVPTWSWFSPFTGMSTNSFASASLVAIFVYWGWDTVLSVNEESKDSRHLPGVSAIVSTLALVATFVLVAVATEAYHGAPFLSNHSSDVLSPLARSVLGSPLDRLVLLAVFTSGIASTLTTLLPTSRSTLAMAVHGAFPKVFGRTHPKYQTPFWGTIIIGLASMTWFVCLSIVSTNTLYNSVDGLGFLVAFYYGLTGFACPLFYRHQLLKSPKNFLLMGLVPFAGAGALTWAFFDSAVVNSNPANAYGSAWFGLGPPFVIGLGVIVLGTILMFVQWIFKPEFFRRKPQTAESLAARERAEMLLPVTTGGAAVETEGQP